MTTVNRIQSERKPLLALTAAFLLPGLGQVYNGEITKGLSFFLVLAFAVPLAAWIALHGPEIMLWLVVLVGVVLTLTIYVLAIWDAYRTAKRLGTDYVLQPINRPSSYLAMMFFGYFIVFGQIAQYTKDNLIEAFSIPSTSMVPSLLPGDRIFVDKRLNRPGASEVHRGDVAIFIYPNNRTQMYVKRVIGLPGDKVEIKGTSVWVNGKELGMGQASSLGSANLDRLLEDQIAYREVGDEVQYLVIWKKSGKHEPLSVEVPNGQVFVLGDDRDDSHDSRKFGTLPLTDIVAKVKQVWFSRGDEDGVRWGRFGKIVD